MTLWNVQHSTLHNTRKGQVMIEFALATVGVMVIAFVSVRVAQWLGQTMVERNDSFQATRAQAGQSGSLVKVGGPLTDLHLVGPGAGRTAGAPEQGIGPSALPKGCPGGEALLAQARAHRGQAHLLWNEALGLHGQMVDKLNQVTQTMETAKDLEAQLEAQAAALEAQAAALELAASDPLLDPAIAAALLAQAAALRDQAASLRAQIPGQKDEARALAKEANGYIEAIIPNVRGLREQLLQAEEWERQALVACSRQPL